MIPRTTTLLVTLAALLAFAVPADAGAAMGQITSANWAGYAVSKPRVRFHSVAGSWVQPAASCGPGERRYSAYWVGLGGLHSKSTALEQIGTQVDCSSKGDAFYSAWYELVPAGPVSIHLKVRPGDRLSAKVTVSRGVVKLYLANRTRGTVFQTQRRPRYLDVTAAEWIVEAPSACDSISCHTLPLADFGSASFAGARATTTAGRSGAIANSAWSPTAIALSPHPAGSFPTSLDLAGSAAGATPSDLSASGDAFTVTYNGAPATPPVPEPPPVEPAPPPVVPAPPPVAPAPIPVAPASAPPGGAQIR